MNILNTELKKDKCINKYRKDTIKQKIILNGHMMEQVKSFKQLSMITENNSKINKEIGENCEKAGRL